MSPLWQLQSLRNEWKGLVAPPAVGGALMAGRAAINALPAAGGPDPWDREKVPR